MKNYLLSLFEDFLSNLVHGSVSTTPYSDAFKPRIILNPQVLINDGNINGDKSNTREDYLWHQNNKVTEAENHVKSMFHEVTISNCIVKPRLDGRKQSRHRHRYVYSSAYAISPQRFVFHISTRNTEKKAKKGI